MRTTINIQSTAPADLARQLRSLAKKLDADALTPGADIRLDNMRVQVAAPQEHDIRAFARERGIPVGTRGRFSRELLKEYHAHQTRSAVAKLAAKKRKEKSLQDA